MQKEYLIFEKALNHMDSVCEKIIKKESYAQELPECVEAVTEAVTILLEEGMGNQEVILELLEGMTDGIQRQDEVFLLDVLRFGLRGGLEECCNQFGD